MRAAREMHETKVSSVTLTSALARLESERRNIQNRDSQRHSEIVALKSTAQRTLDEVDRLRHIIHDLETTQSTLVSQDIVLEMQHTIDKLQADLRDKEQLHKELIYRYGLLKSVIESAFGEFPFIVGCHNFLIRRVLSL